jgi:fucose 4-O-acetylase-like acetyltransferase
VADSPGRALRLPWLDLYKGLAILLVVLGHMNIPARASQLIYSFHVPLFFIASGYVMALGRQTSFRIFLARRWRTLLLPYFVFSLVGLVALLLFLPQEGGFRYTLTRSLLGILYGNGAVSPKTVLTPLWFLTCLFATELLFLGVQRLGRGRLGPMAALVAALLGLGLLNAAALRVPLPWGGTWPRWPSPSSSWATSAAASAWRLRSSPDAPRPWGCPFPSCCGSAPPWPTRGWT